MTYTHIPAVSAGNRTDDESEGPIAKWSGLPHLSQRGDGKPLEEVVVFNQTGSDASWSCDGIARGCTMVQQITFRVPVAEELVGRILDGLGQPIDNNGPVTPTGILWNRQ